MRPVLMNGTQCYIVFQPDFEIKGDKPFTENYSVIGPEVLTGPMGETLGDAT